MTKIAAIMSFFTALVVAAAVYGSVMAQTTTTSPTSTPMPTGVVPTSPPSTGRG